MNITALYGHVEKYAKCNSSEVSQQANPIQQIQFKIQFVFSPDSSDSLSFRLNPVNTVQFEQSNSIPLVQYE